MQEQSNNRELLSIKKTAQLLGFSPSYIAHLIGSGQLDYVLPPGHTHKKISRKAIQEFINNNTFNNGLDYYDNSYNKNILTGR